MKMSELFYRCLSADYIKVGESADYAVEKRAGNLFLFFQDSDGAVDWKNNLDFPSMPYEKMDKSVWRAHRGFLRVWKEIEPYVSGYIMNENIKRITVAGYSHGAAVALLCHEYVWYNRPDLRKKLFGYGFGCPRVFWGRSCADLCERWENFTVIRNINDIVTHLPPAVIGYRHVGKMLEVGEKGKYSNIEAHFAENILIELANYEEKTQAAPVFL
ncbi:MAG: lipase family protein [Ruminococcaceae bacterium]|nr:lipase family protein [Oscillospiraceae bacterium]